VPCLGLNGGPAFKHSAAFSFQIVTDNQKIDIAAIEAARRGTAH
jgi:predicted 3-demethylubiquinone-9 3-methyltransferase (glyoxalase superfamily)